MKYHLKYVSSEIYEDSYEEGETEYTGCGLPVGLIDITFESMKDVIKYLADFHGLSEDINDYDIEGEFVNTSKMVANHSEEQNGGWMEPTKKEMDNWKLGKQKLYVENFIIKVIPDSYDELLDALKFIVGLQFVRGCSPEAMIRGINEMKGVAIGAIRKVENGNGL